MRHFVTIFPGDDDGRAPERPCGPGWRYHPPMVLLLLACADPAPAPEPVAFCDGPVRFRFAPGEELAVFPDDHWTVPADTPTGRRVAIDAAALPDSDDLGSFVAIYDDLSTLDGWGLTAGMWFQADGPLPPAPEVRVMAAGEDWPVDVSFTDDGQTLVLLPRRPLPPATEVTAVVLTDPEAADCLAPAEHTRALLDPATPSPPPEAARHQAALAALGEPPERVAAMTVFTTQSATRLSERVAAIVAEQIVPTGTAGCVDEGRWRTCEAWIEAADFRADDHVVPPDSEGEVLGSYVLPVRVWLPDRGEAPWPTVLCGHGLGGDRNQCRMMAEIAAERDPPVAVVAVDAVEHGDHPERTEAELSVLEDLMILAISVDPPGLDARRLRDNFRQSAWDKLQLSRAIALGFDADGDGAADLDPERVAYVGVSLGALMGPEPMALDRRFDGGVLLVGGGRVASIISDSPTFGVLVDLMRPPGASDGEVDRFFPLLQTVIDAGDPAVWAARVVGDRLDGASPPSVLNGMVFEDQIVPNSTNEALARALALPGVGTEEWPVADLAFAPGPLSGNLAGGATGGTVQFTWVQEVDGGEWVAATHDDLHESATGQDLFVPFLAAVLAGETPVIESPARP